MGTSYQLHRLRTWILCLIALLGVLALGAYSIKIAASAGLVLAVGAIVAGPLAAWIGGKAWASSMTMLTAFANKDGEK